MCTIRKTTSATWTKRILFESSETYSVQVIWNIFLFMLPETQWILFKYLKQTCFFCSSHLKHLLFKSSETFFCSCYLKQNELCSIIWNKHVISVQVIWNIFCSSHLKHFSVHVTWNKTTLSRVCEVWGVFYKVALSIAISREFYVKYSMWG